MGFHGVMEQERRVGNEFVYDIVISYDFSRGAVNDDLDGTLNYAEAVDVVKEVNAIPSKLLENVAWRLNEALRERFPAITSLEIKVTKPWPPIPNAQLAGVSVSLDT